MAGYECNVCESDKPVVLLLTSLVTGQTMASCADDVPVALIGQLAATLEVDGQRLYDAVKRFVDREAKSAAKAQTQADTADPAGTPADDDPPDREYDPGDAVDDQGGMSELAQLAQEGE